MNAQQAKVLRKAIIHHTIANEGGLVNHPDDPGGITNYGISLRWLRKQNLQLGDVDGDGDIDADDVRGVDFEKAAELYHAKFWDSMYAYMLPVSMITVARVFDLAVNTGPRQSHKFLQRALNTLDNGQADLVVDGVLGEKTSTMWSMAIGFCGDEVVHEKVCQQAERFYSKLALKKGMDKFLAGWMNRLHREINLPVTSDGL